MPINDTGLTLLSTTLQAKLVYAQLHSNPAGMSGMDNIAVPGRQLIHWTPPSEAFGVISELVFTGGLGLAGSPVYSFTAWDAETGGVYYGEYRLKGDNTFNAEGVFGITAIDVTGTSEDT